MNSSKYYKSTQMAMVGYDKSSVKITQRVPFKSLFTKNVKKAQKKCSQLQKCQA